VRHTPRRRSAIDRRTTRHPGYAASQRARKRIEEAFGWMKTIAGLRQTKLRGLEKVDWAFTFAAFVGQSIHRIDCLSSSPSNLVRLPKLMASA
jgi:hypothetical protein